MATKPVDFVQWVFSYKRLLHSSDTAAKETDGLFHIRSTTAAALGLMDFHPGILERKRHIEQYNRDATLPGDQILTSHIGPAAEGTITVRAHDRTLKNKLARGLQVALVSYAKPNPTSKGKVKTTRSIRFHFPNSCSEIDMNLALSQLFAKVPALLSDTAGSGGTAGVSALLKPYFYTLRGGRHRFITDSTALTDLSTTYGVQVAFTAAEEAAEDATAATDSKSTTP